VKNIRTEDEFGNQLLKALDLPPRIGQAACHKSLLYALSIDSDGNVRMGVNSESGEPIRGGGKGFEQDLLIWKPAKEAHTSMIPRVSVELKLGGVTTHDAIVYSEKARRLRAIYPYARFGLILGGLPSIPGRVLRLGHEFDFICTLQVPFVRKEIKALRAILIKEAGVSRKLAATPEKGQKLRFLHRKLILRSGLTRG
jgi:hypothetical protein